METKDKVAKSISTPTRKLVVVISAVVPGAREIVGGRPLFERALTECRRMGLEKIFLVADEEFLDTWQRKGNLLPSENFIRFRGNVARDVYRARIVKGSFIFIDGSYLIDPRLIKFLISAQPSCYFPMSSQNDGLALGLFTKLDLEAWATYGIEAVLDGSRRLSLSDIDPYNPEIRGEQEPYLVKVSSKLDAAKATWTLITSNQKKVMDLPSMYIDPPFENTLTFALCYTPVTPNQVTIFNLIVAFLVGCLFWTGHFIAGALLTYAAEILDGVDGKLARAKIIFSKLGEYECYVDFFYEHWWYIAIAAGLRHQGYDSSVWWAWGILAVSDIWDNILYTMSEHWYGKSLDLLTPFDASFRKIAGRRNIYALIFLIGFLLGYPFATFWVAAVWGLITASIHTYRLASYRMRKRAAVR